MQINAKSKYNVKFKLMELKRNTILQWHSQTHKKGAVSEMCSSRCYSGYLRK